MTRKIIILGGSGQIGTTLARHFHALGDHIISTSRNPKPSPWQTDSWDATNLGPWAQHFESSDAVINLSGSTINTRFTPENRKLILDSRIHSTRLTAQAIRNCKIPPTLWINASAVDIYPHTLHPLEESDIQRYEDTGALDLATPESWRFISQVVYDWEQAFFSETIPYLRKIALRTTLMLSPDKGGVFQLLLRLTRFGAGGRQGSGQQFVSWMHDQDYARAVDFLIKTESIEGPINITSPNPIPNQKFMHNLRQTAHVPIGLPAPTFGIQIASAILRTEPVLILKSRNSIPRRLASHGFQWSFPTWPEAAKDLVSRYHRSTG